MVKANSNFLVRKQTYVLYINIYIYMKLQCLSLFFRNSSLWNKQTSTWSDWWTIWTWTSLIFLFSPAPPLQTASGRFPLHKFRHVFLRVARATGFCAGPRPISSYPSLLISAHTRDLCTPITWGTKMKPLKPCGSSRKLWVQQGSLTQTMHYYKGKPSKSS